jgi:CRISPR-associated protein Cas6
MSKNNIPEMTDLVFDLDGGTLPAAYPFALWAALLRHVPELAAEKSVGVLPLRATDNTEGVLLPKRAKLVLRLPSALASLAAARLTGSTVHLGDIPLLLGKCKPRAIGPSPTLHAQMVTGDSDEVRFMAGIHTRLSEIGIAANLICGKRHTLSCDQQSIHGYSLVVHDLKPEASLQLQYAGLGANRQFGFGIFIPYKVISGLSDD